MVKNNSEAIRPNQIEPLNPNFVRDTSQEEWLYVTGADNCATLSILATHDVPMASVDTTYNKIHPVVLNTGFCIQK